jgi:hypothetical protein
MSIRRWSFALVFLAALVPGSTLAQGPVRYTPLVVGWERFFVVTSQTTQVGGQARVSGQVLNDWGFPARRIQLLIDALDASGQITGQSVVWLGYDLGPGSRGYFDVPAPPGTRHRVSIFAFDWVQTAFDQP